MSVPPVLFLTFELTLWGILVGFINGYLLNKLGCAVIQYTLMSVEAPDTGDDTVLWTTFTNAKTRSSEAIRSILSNFC